MPTSRVTSKRLPVCPGQDSRYTIRHNPNQNNEWWVYHRPQSSVPIPADDPHPELVNRVNRLKEIEGQPLGGSFSINEHSQVVARMNAVAGYPGNASHVVDVADGFVFAYRDLITFGNGALDPSVTPVEGAPWPGPLCGTTDRFAAPGNPKPPSHNVDEVWIEVDGANIQLSRAASVSPYPPATGPLADFLAALRRQLPSRGRFRVNECGRAFTSNSTTFVGLIPAQDWFRKILPTD